jgi:hypothetical protein
MSALSASTISRILLDRRFGVRNGAMGRCKEQSEGGTPVAARLKITFTIPTTRVRPGIRRRYRRFEG